MKLLQVINSLGAGGAEKLVVDTALLYSEKGIDVDILLLNGENTPLCQQIKAHGSIKVLSLKGNIYSPLKIFSIRTIFKNYDIIHAHLFPVSYWVAFANMLSFKKKPIIFTEHNTTNRRRSIFIFKMIDRVIYKQFEKVVTISDAVDKNLKLHLGLKKKTNRVQKIHNGIHLNQIQNAIPYSKEELNFKKTDQLVIQVASFTAQKDQKTLIKAIAVLPENIKLILVGTGPLIDQYKTLVNDKKLEAKVYFYGVRKDVPRLLKSVDIVVLSSHYEGLSLSSIEGLASGKPFIASNTPGLGEIVKDSGIIFEDNDHNALANAISKLLNNKLYGEQIVNQCIKKAQYYDINLMVSSYIELFKNLQ
ncbi:glycosyltransferase [Aquimarina agarivorans]|uniref:glycosyltransferase n=1 Tax=Aquimarina agarivorans TaxID=980584 RepID=UPI000248E7DA|nr:glycosyltransferase [Aquimarina agarivorans]